MIDPRPLFRQKSPVGIHLFLPSEARGIGQGSSGHVDEGLFVRRSRRPRRCPTLPRCRQEICQDQGRLSDTAWVFLCFLLCPLVNPYHYFTLLSCRTQKTGSKKWDVWRLSTTRLERLWLALTSTLVLSTNSFTLGNMYSVSHRLRSLVVLFLLVGTFFRITEVGLVHFLFIKFS